MIDRIIDVLLALTTHQIAGSRDAPTTHLSCITRHAMYFAPKTGLKEVFILLDEQRHGTY